ncbi:MAG: Leucyl-tRNA synthetase, mitochondrial [Pycnora praestabilis]|nr:MAG: Leucyl-tRNA synthetase, mitochondrial [Pycnora praestabilis]
MFPYPSGTLHLGHFRNYTISDVLARFKHMQGYDVLHAIGWDAFGLPAENAAIERGVDPAAWTRQNVASMKEQLKMMGGRWDWSRELMTCDPQFYKHTQRIFLLLYERGLAYQAESLVNYDPVDRTVLANEQVDTEGFSWRSGAKVERLRLKQWFLRITTFKEALLEDLDLLSKDSRWPERVLSMQRNWLGKSLGAKIRFPVIPTAKGEVAYPAIEAFTTRPDTVFGVQYLALSTTHPIVLEIAKSSSQLQTFLETASSLSQDTKAGFLLQEISATNPATFLEGARKQPPLPIYVAPYVLGDYGEGAVMGVPGHDNRDHAFWRANRGSEPISSVVAPPKASQSSVEPSKSSDNSHEAYVGDGELTSLCDSYAGVSSVLGGEMILSDLHKGGFAEHAESWRLRDWLISRQRYWGTPIPIIHCKNCGVVPVPVDQLPVELPKLEGEWFKGKGGNPLEGVQDWVNTPCPSCGAPARRDTDTMDTFVDSSWYYLRFTDPHNPDVPFSAEAADANLPVNIYIGGVEHAILHLLYARFISKFLATSSLWPSGSSPDYKGEPFQKLITQGMVHGITFSDPQTGRFLKPSEIDLSDPAKPMLKATGEVPTISYEKMSKSKYNGVDPATCISKYGADATRAHMLFQAPVSEVLEWDEHSIIGIQRWFGRVWRIVQEIKSAAEADFYDSTSSHSAKREDSPLSDGLFHPTNIGQIPPLTSFNDTEASLYTTLQSAIISITTSLSSTYALNTVVSDLIKLTNAISSTSIAAAGTLAAMADPAHTSLPIYYATTSALLRMMAPLTPAFAEECWELIHTSSSSKDGVIQLPSVHTQPFPTPLPASTISALATRDQPCAVQINGKLRFAISIPRPPPSKTSCSAFIQAEDDPALALANKPTQEDPLRDWVLGRVLESKEGKKWLTEKNDIRTAKRVVIVKGGRTVNIVF